MLRRLLPVIMVGMLAIGLGAINGKSDKRWDTEPIVEILTISGHSDAVNSVCFSPDGKYVLSGSRDGTAKLWSLPNGDELKTFSGHSGAVNSVCFSPDGKYVLSGSDDATMKLWDLTTNRVMTFSGHTGPVNSVCFSPDGKYVLSGVSKYLGLGLWDAETASYIGTYRSGTYSAGYAGYASDGSTMSGCFSPDGRYVLAGTGGIYNIDIWHTDDPFSVPGSYWRHQAPGKMDRVTVASVCFSPDGEYILSGASDTNVKLWYIGGPKDKPTKTLVGHKESVTSVCFSPDGKYVLSGSRDRTAKLWSLPNGDELKTFSGHSGAVNSVCFSPDGKYVLSGSRDGTAKLWNAERAIAP